MGRSLGSGHEESGVVGVSDGKRSRGPDVEGVEQQRVSSRQPQPANQTRHCITQEEQGDAKKGVESSTRRGNRRDWVRHRHRSGSRGKKSFILSHTNQNMGPWRDVTPSLGGGGIVNQLRARRRDVDGRSGRTRWRRRRRRHVCQGGNSMCTNRRDTRKSWGKMLYGEGEETVASMVGRERRRRRGVRRGARNGRRRGSMRQLWRRRG